MSAFFKVPASPILTFADAAELRAEPSALLRTGTFGNVDGEADLVRYDAAETSADDGVNYWIPDDVDPGDPGRWVLFPVGGGGASGPDFTDPVLHVNAGGAVPSTGLYGLSVNFTLGANRRGIFWDAANTRWALAQDTLGDDSTISSYLPLRCSDVLADSVTSTTSGTAPTGLLRMGTGDEIRARIGSAYRLAAALSGPVLAFGDSTAAKTTIDAASSLVATVASGPIDLCSDKVVIKDAGGATTLLEAATGSASVAVTGSLAASASLLSPLFDTSTAVPMTIGTTATKITLKALATAGDGVAVQVDGVAATSGGGGLSVANTTDTSSPAASVQRSPPLSWKGRARVSSVDTGFVIDSQLIPTTGGNWQLLFRKSTDGGSTYSEIGRLTNTSPSQFLDAFYMASGFSAGLGTTGFVFDADGSGLNRGGSGDLQVLARASSIAMLLRSPVTASVAAFRLYASGDTRGASKVIAEFGDVAAGFTQRSAIMGDGTYAGPAWVEVAAQTANYTAAARQRVALTSTGGAFDFTLPTAVGCAGQQIKAYMTAASANVVTLKTTSAQTISGSASGTLTLGNAVSIETALFTSDGSNWWFERSSTAL